MAPLHRLFISDFFLNRRFLGVSVNIKDLGVTDRPDVLHRSYLTDLSGIPPVSSPHFRSVTRCLRQAAVWIFHSGVLGRTAKAERQLLNCKLHPGSF